ncbi:MAG: hypothetical protein LBT40_01940 [Deltaproteobacteria bacterium]|nr:hypothetical protein [Deltaproteobacteria bacterium]
MPRHPYVSQGSAADLTSREVLASACPGRRSRDAAGPGRSGRGERPLPVFPPGG